MIDTQPRIAGRTELLLCRCLKVTEEEVVSAIQLYGASSLCEVRRCTGAGTGCNSCHVRIHACIEAARR